MLTAPYRIASTRPLTPEDVEEVVAYLAMESERATIRWRVMMEGPNTVFLLNGTIAAAGGFQLHNMGTAEPWLVLTPEGKQHFRPLYRAIVAWLIEQLDAWKLHRLQAIVRWDDTRAVVLLEHLGFTFEGTAKQFGPDRADYEFWAWVRGG